MPPSDSDSQRYYIQHKKSCMFNDSVCSNLVSIIPPPWTILLAIKRFLIERKEDDWLITLNSEKWTFYKTANIHFVAQVQTILEKEYNREEISR